MKEADIVPEKITHLDDVTGSHVTISWKLKEIKSTSIEAKRVANKSTMVQTEKINKYRQYYP